MSTAHETRVLGLPMRDVTQDAGEEMTYECFECGNIVVDPTTVGNCPECGGELRNRGMPIE
ncbi:rubrerythrin-like domain-containing protein [Natranaeroarchaeum aerophilus]